MTNEESVDMDELLKNEPTDVPDEETTEPDSSLGEDDELEDDTDDDSL